MVVRFVPGSGSGKKSSGSARGTSGTISEYLDIRISGTTVKKIDGPEFKNRLGNLNDYFQEQLETVTQRLANAGANAGRKALREATTPWGNARMAGEYYGVRFRPFGRSAGRERTGYMYDSLSGWVEPTGSRLYNRWQGYFGWSPEVLRGHGYIELQAQGFYSTGSFDPVATERSGIAKFKAGKEKFVEGAYPLTPAFKLVNSIQESFYSGAWNEAVRKWNADGFKGNPGSYLSNRKRKPPKRYFGPERLRDSF